MSFITGQGIYFYLVFVNIKHYDTNAITEWHQTNETNPVPLTQF